MPNLIDLTGQTFGRLTVIERHPVIGNAKQVRWRCICDCGTESVVIGNSLRSGATRSCGCLWLGSTITANRGNAYAKKHGAAARSGETSEYMAWAALKRRCLNPANRGYKNYGGRGIDIDPRWIASFEAFLADIGPKPSPELSIDRIDNDRGYWPDNVRWATRSEQARNRRKPIRAVH